MLPNDIKEEIQRQFLSSDTQSEVGILLQTLWEIPLNVSPTQLARCILLLSKKSLFRIKNIFESELLEDPRNILVEANALYPQFNFGLKPFFELSLIKWREDDVTNCTERIFISNLDIETEIWVDKEQENQPNFSPKQASTFQNFLNIEKSEIEKMYKALEKYGLELAEKKRITKSSLRKRDAFKLYFDALLLPIQQQTDKSYIFLLPNTRLKIRNSNYCIELEVLFEDNKFILLQEMTGLWTRLEWEYIYNTENPV